MCIILYIHIEFLSVYLAVIVQTVSCINPKQKKKETNEICRPTP